MLDLIVERRRMYAGFDSLTRIEGPNLALAVLHVPDACLSVASPQYTSLRCPSKRKTRMIYEYGPPMVDQ